MLETLSKEIDMLDELTTKKLEFLKANSEALLKGQTLPEYPFENNIKRDINLAERIHENDKQIQEELKKGKKKRKRSYPASSFLQAAQSVAYQD